MNNKTIIIIAIVLLIIWGSLIYIWVSYAEELRSHPCQVCADRMGEEVVCSAVSYPPKQQNFIPNPE